MFVPAHKDDLIRKAFDSEADAIIFDLEDSCPAKSREKGIENINLYSKLTAKTTIVRIGEIDHVRRVKADYILYPKAEYFLPFAPPDQKAILLIETSLGVMNLFNMLRAYSENIHSVVFGNEDYFADSGCQYYSFAQSTIVNCAKAYNKLAIDTVHVDVHNIDDLKAKCGQSVKMGFDGKLCIHPKEVEVVNAFYTPTTKKYDHAKRIVELYRQAEEQGDGVAILDGVYVAPPMVRRAEKIIIKYEDYT